MEWITVARRQGGLISRRQLIAAEVHGGTIDPWIRRGWLETTTVAGVYRAPGAPWTPDSAVWFAVLSTRSPLSYLSAAHWWDVPVQEDRLVHVTRLGRRRLDWPTGVRVHRSALAPDAVTERLGMPVTNRVETLLDCLGWLKLGAARTLADRAVQQGWMSERDVQRRLENQPGRWGNRQLKALLGQFVAGADAESERRLHTLMRQAGLRGWVAQMPFVAGGSRYFLDVAFPEFRLAIEVDGYAYHRSDDRFQADRTKQNALMAAGWRVLRFTWADLEDRPDYVIARIRQLLAA